MEEFFDFFEANKQAVDNGEKYKIDLEDSDSFIDAMSVIQENDWFDLSDDSVVYDDSENKATFYNKDYTVHFDGNFTNDTYYMTIEKGGKK